jgi:hypothetical protein
MNDEIKFKKLPLLSSAGEPLAKFTLEHLWADVFALKMKVLKMEGDPGTDPNADPLLFIQDFLADPVLTSGLHCIHIGFVDDEIAAFTVVQINSKTGWSRISYMGDVPKFRKKNLEVWVHRYSFKIMKSEGGKLYHGGTTSTNIRMIKLFENSGCDKFCEMEEWNYSLNEGVTC